MCMSVDVPEQHRSAAVSVVERSAADGLRRTADVVVSSLLLVLFVVPMLLIAVAIHLEDKGPAFFRQERVGLGGAGSPC